MVSAWYCHTAKQLERVAWRYGYALAVHGTMGRDLDLVAIPWVEDAADPERLMKAFCRAVSGKGVDVRVDLGTKKPHGRTAYVIPLGFEGQYLDISVMPRKRKER